MILLQDYSIKHISLFFISKFDLYSLKPYIQLLPNYDKKQEERGIKS
jgi:hypothetical protein